MKISRILLITFCLLSLIIPAIAQEQPNQEEAMKRWTEFMTPGNNHKFLAKRAGTWKVKTTSWMAPGAPPEINDGTAEGKMILGGRYLVLKHKGNMMGMPFEGINISAYDNYKKMFLSTWLDNMGTGFFISQGKLSKDGKTFTEIGEIDDVMNKTTIKMKTINTIIDDNKFIMLMYNIYPGGKEVKTMEVVYTRVK